MAGPIRSATFSDGIHPQWIRLQAVGDGPLPLPPQSGVERIERPMDLTVAEFVARKFLPEHIATKRTPGRRHYHAILKHILSPDYVDQIFGAGADLSKTKLQVNPNWPYLDKVRLRDIQTDHVQRLMSMALEMGYSTQTAKHIRNVLSAVISHAIKSGYFLGGNPALLVAPPGMQRRTLHTLTFDQTVKVLQAMRYPEWEVCLIAIMTGMSIAEICGLQWKYVNLTDHAVESEGELIPPMSIAVRKQSYRGEVSVVPDGRRKNAPIPYLLQSVLLLLSRAKGAGRNDFVLMSRTGSPINQINLAARRLKAIGEQLGIPWLSWQVFRRTRARLINEFGAQLQKELAVAITIKRDPLPTMMDRYPPR